MATSIQNIDVVPTTFVTKTSRYSASQVVLYGDNKLVTFATYKRRIPPLSQQDMYTVIPPGEEYRPDLTSYRAYNTVDFWWYIMESNGIFDVFDYKAGTNIRIPSPFNLM